jgi:hypothetical protein
VRHPADILHQIGGDLADTVAAQGEGIGEAAEAMFDGIDDLVVAADCGE